MRGGLLAIAYVAVVTGCSYDWTYPAGGSADAGADSPSPYDGQADAPGDSSGPDASSEAASDSPPNDSPASDSTPANCTALEAQVRQDRAAAIQCVSGPSACMTTVLDECGCEVVVGDGASVATQTYGSAVQQLKTNCPSVVIACQACGPKPQTGLCVLSDGGGSTLACYQ
jgi:hypothetical protein